MQHDAHNTNSRVLRNLAVGGVVTAAAIILSPHILPAIGIGDPAMAEESMFVLHTSAERGGSGLAGIMGNLLSNVPLVGEKLAEGGLFNTASTAIVGAGGMLLGKAVQKREAHNRLGWGKIIQYAALATSAMIALPTVLSALSTGLIFLSTLAGSADFSNSVISTIDRTLGTSGGDMTTALMGFSGAAAALPHFLTCGVALVPAALSYGIGDDPTNAATVQGGIAIHTHVDAPTKAGQPCHATLTLTHADSGSPLTASELAVVHTEKLHLLLVDETLKDYHHLHPQPTSTPGEFAFSFTPRSPARYNAWADFTLHTGENLRIKAPLNAASNLSLSANIRVNNHAEKAGLRVDWQSFAPLCEREASTVTLHITDASGAPVTDLQPVMGAFAHMVGFSADGNSVLHCHPLGREPEQADERGGPTLSFHIQPEAAGMTQFYVQLRRNNEDIYIPFGQQVQAGLRTERMPQQCSR